jgi:carbonic anhydrase
MKIRTLLLALCATTLGASGSSDGPTTRYTPTDALDLLMAGNVRYSSGMPEHRNTGIDRIAETATGQSPFAIVLACADSRVPAELVFDRGVGDIFVVRVAGNTSGAFQAGSIEYAVEHLGTPLIVVMGHTSCGAVGAAASGAEVHGNIGAILAPIAPAIQEAKAAAPDASPTEVAGLAVRYNVMRSMNDLILSSPAIASGVQGGSVRMVGAVYDLSTGRVEWIGQHPQQAAILSRAMERAGGTASDAAHASAGHDDGRGDDAHDSGTADHGDGRAVAPASKPLSVRTAATSGAKPAAKHASAARDGEAASAQTKPPSKGATPGAKPASQAHAQDDHHDGDH